MPGGADRVWTGDTAMSQKASITKDSRPPRRGHPKRPQILRLKLASGRIRERCRLLVTRASAGWLTDGPSDTVVVGSSWWATSPLPHPARTMTKPTSAHRVPRRRIVELTFRAKRCVCRMDKRPERQQAAPTTQLAQRIRTHPNHPFHGRRPVRRPIHSPAGTRPTWLMTRSAQHGARKPAAKPQLVGGESRQPSPSMPAT